MAAHSDIIRAIGTAIVDALLPGRTPAGRADQGPAGPGSDYPGDFHGPTTLSYDPRHDGTADPGEVVWTWVPYEEDHRQGKDRPVLVIGRDGPWLLAVPMTSQDHDRDAAQEAAAGRYWVEIGSGGWDAEGRVSEVRVDRIVRVDPDRVRRLADRIDPEVFAAVAEGVRRHW